MRKRVAFKVTETDGASLEEIGEAIGGRVVEVGESTWVELSIDPDLGRNQRGAGSKRRGLPAGSPLRGLDEEAAERWAACHDPVEVQRALGVARATYYQRLRSGRLLPRDEGRGA